MPHSTDASDNTEDRDEWLIQQFLTPENVQNLDLDRDLIPGEKADDAIDYGDLSLTDEDDLPDEEEAEVPSQTNPIPSQTSLVPPQANLVPAQTSSSPPSGGEPDVSFDILNDFTPAVFSQPVETDTNSLDELFFGEMSPSSPPPEEDEEKLTPGVDDADEPSNLFGSEPSDHQADHTTTSDKTSTQPQRADDSTMSKEEQLQQYLFSVSRAKVYGETLTQPQRADDSNMSEEEKLQLQLFALSRSNVNARENGTELPPVVIDPTRTLATVWPDFDPNSIPRFMKLLPTKRARYIGKKPAKPPKPVQPTKLTLELAPDHEKLFTTFSNPSDKAPADDGQPKVIMIRPPTPSDDGSTDNVDLAPDIDTEPIGGISWQDIQIACQDWAIPSPPSSPVNKSPRETDEDISPLKRRKIGHDESSLIYRSLPSLLPQVTPSDGRPAPQQSTTSSSRNTPVDRLPYEANKDTRSPKRRKTDHKDSRVLFPSSPSPPPLSDPEKVTAEIAKRVILDLNDPELLIEDEPPKAGLSNDLSEAHPTDKSQRPKKWLKRKYNISNDDAYELLKENHQSKTRSNLGNLTIEHSIPALRLQWPYYKTKLEKQEARSFHRPKLIISDLSYCPLNYMWYANKKYRGKDAASQYRSTARITLSDSSKMMLLEYSEEHPVMLSNFGMSSRLINYYRRKGPEDMSRPKLEIGETNVLLPHDKSPFSNFGHINPGEIMPTIYNNMYKAPVFKHEAASMDFLIVRNKSMYADTVWYLRNVEHLHVVGQQFPSVEVPGPHSRKVTTAAKNRLKMLSYRMIKKSSTGKIRVSEITEHFPETSDMQNRQKMKEFMQFDKEGKEWEMRPGEAIPDSDAIRSMVKPEDVCLLESMQVGQQYLQDAGLSREDDESSDDDATEGQNVEQMLAPWFTSRNFLNAVQGKAMLQLHGEGDPSGRGEAFSFIKTSMKGGFRPVGESVEEKIDAKKMREMGGHSYNVVRQQKAYDESAIQIWNAQKRSLKSTQEHSDPEREVGYIDEPIDASVHVRTPQSEVHTPVSLRRQDDETGSQYTGFSREDQGGKALVISRQVENEDGDIDVQEDVIRNPKIIKEYLRRRRARDAAAHATALLELKPIGDAEADRRNHQKLNEELLRLQRNKDRRIKRDRQRAQQAAANTTNLPSTTAPTTTARNAGTQRKCANCGAVGHIKTNKKLCPMLNGTWNQATQNNAANNSPFVNGAPGI
ncbi:MAG: hypothetical protein LQ351_000781 [Letrouitia transgressa]|nr:MAG: hypothetical protein LQ351_000781 [Letrouitia transgressa]